MRPHNTNCITHLCTLTVAEHLHHTLLHTHYITPTIQHAYCSGASHAILAASSLLALHVCIIHLHYTRSITHSASPLLHQTNCITHCCIISSCIIELHGRHSALVHLLCTAAQKLPITGNPSIRVLVWHDCTRPHACLQRSQTC